MPFLDARHPQVLTVASRHADIRVSRPRRTARIPDHAAAILFRPTVYAGWCESATPSLYGSAVRRGPPCLPTSQPCRVTGQRSRGRRKPLAFSGAPPGTIAAPTLPRVPLDVGHRRKPDALHAVSPLPGLSHDVERPQARGQPTRGVSDSCRCAAPAGAPRIFHAVSADGGKGPLR